MKVLMVCLGNICRSPLAEGILQHQIHQRSLDWRVDSAGTGSWHVGERPDPRSIATARQYGIDISSQRARQFTPADLNDYDLIFAMDSSNYRDILRQAQKADQEAKVDLIMNLVQPGYNQNVPDPYYDSEGFEKVYQMLAEACEKLVEKYTE
ncbi:MAG: low molecular weight protein-tyrosine-phosphatase [Bacteroidota bacterium]